MMHLCITQCTYWTPLCLLVCMSACQYVWMYVCLYPGVRACVAYVCMRVCMCACACACLCVCLYVFVCTWVYIIVCGNVVHQSRCCPLLHCVTSSVKQTNARCAAEIRRWTFQSILPRPAQSTCLLIAPTRFVLPFHLPRVFLCLFSLSSSIISPSLSSSSFSFAPPHLSSLEFCPSS